MKASGRWSGLPVTGSRACRWMIAAPASGRRDRRLGDLLRRHRQMRRHRGRVDRSGDGAADDDETLLMHGVLQLKFRRSPHWGCSLDARSDAFSIGAESVQHLTDGDGQLPFRDTSATPLSALLRISTANAATSLRALWTKGDQADNASSLQETSVMAAAVQPFRLHVAESAIDNLQERLARTRFPDQAPGEPWAFGTDVDYMKLLVEYWRDRFDWRAQEARLNSFPQFKVRLHGIDLHFLHVEGKGAKPYPLLLSHGWPGSVFEFLDIIPRLTDPARFGGDPADAFTVIAPSLPGYGLSFKPGQQRFSVEMIADCFAELMTDVLGYERFAAQGGDWGAFITSRLGAVHADKLIGIHLNLLAVRRDTKMLADPTPEEQQFLRRTRNLDQRGDGIPLDSRHAATDACVQAERFSGGAGCVDCRKVSCVVRLRGRLGKRIHEGPPARKHQPVLVHRSHWLVVLALLRAHAWSLADSRGRSESTDGVRRVPARDLAPTTVSG